MHQTPPALKALLDRAQRAQDGAVEVLPPEPPPGSGLRAPDRETFLGPIPAGAAALDVKTRLAHLVALADGLAADLRSLGDANGDRAARRLELVRAAVAAIAPNVQPWERWEGAA